jgi:hypothetical protein
MKRLLLLIICFVPASCSPAFAAAFTAKATGNWSASGQTTWNEVGVPGSGDTVTIGAFTITVDVDTTVGTSPNNNTTNVITLSSATSKLIVATGVTLTVLGNRTAVNSSTYQMNAGSTLVFDASASGGTPVYRDQNGAYTIYQYNGTAGSPVTVQSPLGYNWILGGSFYLSTFTYTNFTRHGSVSTTFVAGDTSITHCVWDSTIFFLLKPIDATANIVVTDNVFQNSVGSGSPVAVVFRIDASTTAGTRTVARNVFDKSVTFNLSGYAIDNNYFGEAFDFGSGSGALASSFTGNLVNQSLSRSASPSYRGTTPVANNYFTYSTAGGNPHFLGATAAGGDLTVSGNIFEQTGTYATDIGDAVFPGSDGSARTITVDNNIVLPISFTGDTATSGTVATLYGVDATRTVKARHNTIAGANPNNSAAIAVAEGGSGHAGELAEWKSNLVWSASTSTQHSASRISGTTNGVIAAAGADYNFRWNINIGDNGRGYDDYAGNLNLWTGAAATTGAAAASNVDDHGVVADPGFIDPTRNIAKWSAYRGGAATTAAGLAMLRADPTLTGLSLLPWVRTGFTPTNPAYQATAHDGTTPGAVSGVFFPALLIAP